jgi:peptidoglycan/xylan/chitin deacetylase (PgdA/CDA1 family)
MNWKHNLLKVCSSVMPELYSPPAGILFPFGHIVSDCVPSHVRRLYRVPTIDKFKSDLDVLCDRYQPLEPSDLERITRLDGHKERARYFLLSFDDGMREIYDVIAPILLDKGIRAIFFLNSATVDNAQLMWRHKVSLLIERSRELPGRVPPQLCIGQAKSVPEALNGLRFADAHLLDEIARFYDFDFNEYLQNVKPYLLRSQILELARAGFEFGGHSETHPCFNEIALEDQKKQVSGSVLAIRALGLPCRYFAFPFHDEGVSASLFGYMDDLNLLASFGVSEARVDSIRHSFQRFALDGENSESSLPDLLKMLSLKALVRGVLGTEVIQRN